MITDVEILLEEIRKITVSSINKNLELTILEEVKEKGVCNFNLIKPIQNIITTYIESLSEQRLKEIYKETETGMINDDAEELYIDSLKMSLEEELLGEVTEDLFNRAANDNTI